MRRWAIMLALAVIVVSCGNGDASVTTTTEPPEQTAVSLVSTTLTTIAAEATTTTTGSTSTTLKEVEVEFVDGEVVGHDRVEVLLGEMVDVLVLSDVDDEMHVHGYDLNFDLEAGVPFHLTFPADVPGVFEVEVHTGPTVLFEIEVTG